MLALTYSIADPARDLPALSRIIAHAFGGTPDEFPAWFEKAGPQHFRVLRETAAGPPLATLLLIRMGQFFGGRSIPMTGIAAVGVAPEARGRGLATHLMHEALLEIKSSGVPLSSLYPATQPLYRRVGYEQAGYRFEYRIPIVRLAPGIKGQDGLKVRGAEPADLDAAKACYREVAPELDGHLDRGDYVWNRILAPRQGPASGFLIESENGVDGYVYLRQDRSLTTRHDVHITDWCATTERGARRVLALAGEFASMGEELVCYGGPSIPILTLLPEQRMSVKLREYWMLRIVDVPGVTAARGWAPGVKAEAHLDIADDLIPENAGPWVIRVENGAARAERGGRGGIKADIGALAAWFSGYATLPTLRRLGRVRAEDDALAGAAGMIAASTPWMPDMF